MCSTQNLARTLNSGTSEVTKCPRDCGNQLVISRVRYIKVLFHTLHYYWAKNVVCYIMRASL